MAFIADEDKVTINTWYSGKANGWVWSATVRGPRGIREYQCRETDKWSKPLGAYKAAIRALYS